LRGASVAVATGTMLESPERLIVVAGRDTPLVPGV
jgi:hypothetical protein